MPTEYVEDERLSKAVQDMVDSTDYPEFAEIRDASIRILPVMCVRLDKDGEPQDATGAPAKIKKIGAPERVFIPDGHYLLVMGYKEWNSYNEIQVKAAIHSALMGIRVDAGEGSVKLKSKKPDLVLHSATVARFGAFDATLADLKTVLGNLGEQTLEVFTRESREKKAA